MRKFCKYFAISLFWLLFLCELTCRTAFREDLVIRSPELEWVNDSLAGPLPKPGDKFTLVEPYINREVTVNQFGFYDDEMRLSRRNGVYRIAIVGGDEEIGIYSNGISYISLCDRLFEERGDSIECLNFSIDGFFRDNARMAIASEKITKFNPDMVVLKVNNPLTYCDEVKEEYNGYLLRYVGGDEKSRHELYSVIDEINEAKISTMIYDLSYLFRFVCGLFQDNDKDFGFWHKMHIYGVRQIPAPDIKQGYYDSNLSTDMINDLNIKLEASGVLFCLLNSNDSSMNYGPQIHFMEMTNTEKLVSAGVLAEELYYLLIKEIKTDKGHEKK